MLDLSSRIAQMGPTINDRTEKHGDEDVPAMDISVSGIMLTIPELAVLLQTAETEVKRLFNMRAQPIEPALSMLEIACLVKLEDVDVALELGLDQYELALPACGVKLTGLTRCTGGLTELSCRLQYPGDLGGDDLERLREAKNKQIEIAFSGGKIAEKKQARKQPELDMDHHAEEGLDEERMAAH